MAVGTRLIIAALAAPLGIAVLAPAAAQSASAWPGGQSDPFTVDAGKVSCGDGGRVFVKLRSQRREVVRYSLTSDDRTLADGSISPRRTVRESLRVPRGERLNIEAYSIVEGEEDTLVDSATIDNPCGRQGWRGSGLGFDRWGDNGWGDNGRDNGWGNGWGDNGRGNGWGDRDGWGDGGDEGWGDKGWGEDGDNDCDNGWDDDCGGRGWGRERDDLPFTGPPADLMGKLATAGGLVLTGGLVWWYGSIWPRQSYSPPPAPRRREDPS
ncbi:hypothetical protein [Nonomuraea longicatena]